MEGTDSDGEISSHEDDAPSPSSCSLGSTRTDDKSQLYDPLNASKQDTLESGDLLCTTPSSSHTGHKGMHQCVTSCLLI